MNQLFPIMSSGTGGGGGGGGGVIPSFVAASAPKGSASSISTLFLPAGHAAQDVLLLVIETGAADAAPVAPSGWGEVTNSPSEDTTGTSAQQTRISVFWKRDSGSEIDPIPVLTDAGDHQMATILAFRNCINTGNPWDVTAKSSAGSATTSLSIPTVTTTVANTLVVLIASTSLEQDDDGVEFSGYTNANLTGITEIVDFTEDNGDGGGFGIAYGFKATAGATGATTATSDHSERHAYMTIALRGQT